MRSWQIVPVSLPSKPILATSLILLWERVGLHACVLSWPFLQTQKDWMPAHSSSPWASRLGLHPSLSSSQDGHPWTQSPWQLGLPHLHCGQQGHTGPIHSTHIAPGSFNHMNPITRNNSSTMDGCNGIVHTVKYYLAIKNKNRNHWCQSRDYSQNMLSKIGQTQKNIYYTIIFIISFKTGKLNL